MVWGTRADDLEAAGPTYVAPPKPEPKFSAWGLATAIPRGVGEAGAQVLGTAADLAGAWKTLRDTPHEKMKGAGLPVEAFSSEFGDSLRDRGREFRPDPATASVAEQVLYGFARGATKVIGGAALGGIPGVVAAGAEEGFSASDDLRRQGVNANTRMNAGAVQGAGLALAALPAAGTTLAGTLGLYAAGGPGGFVAQQALTREILTNAGYDKIGMGYDPFDPVGLAVSALIPAGFAAYGLRQNKIAAAVKSLPDLPARDSAAAPVESSAAPPSDLSPVALAVRGYSDDLVDAARVSLLAERRAAANIGRADDLRAGDQHEAALTRAEQQIAEGSRVEVADVAPAVRVPVIETPEFRAWFEGSKVATPEGAPLVVYHGTRADVEAFDKGLAGSSMDAGKLGRGFYFTEDARLASNYAGSADGANVIPAYLALKNPIVFKADRTPLWPKLRTKSAEWGIKSDPVSDTNTMAPNAQWSIEFADAARAAGHDGVILDFGAGRREIVVFDPEQIKSAIGNSGRFDPSTGSLTDSPYATWEDQIRAAVADMQKRAERVPRAAVDGAPPVAAAPTPPRAAVAGETPAASAEAQAATTRLDAVRAQFPDMEVMLDGMDKPQRLSDFLAAVKAEADEIEADAPLMQIAAECAITFGV